MSTKLSPSLNPLRLEPRPSRYLRGALIGLALCAMAAIFYSAVNRYIGVLGTLFLLVHLGLLLHRYSQPLGRLLWRSEGWLWIDKYYVERVLYLQQATLWPGFIVLRFRDEATQKTHVFIFLADSLDSEEQRRLRLYIRHMPVFNSALDL